MLSYRLKCRKNTESKNPKVTRTKKMLVDYLQVHTRCKMNEIVHKSLLAGHKYMP